MNNDKNNRKKAEQLGMPFGTASNRLRKMVLFHLLKKLKENVCFQCGAEIETVDELSIEHKKPWLDESVDLFWDLNNIAFSHHQCNCASTRHDPNNVGIFHSLSAFNAKELSEIRTRLANGETARSIANDFGHEGTIGKIKRGERYNGQ